MSAFLFMQATELDASWHKAGGILGRNPRKAGHLVGISCRAVPEPGESQCHRGIPGPTQASEDHPGVAFGFVWAWLLDAPKARLV